MNVEVEAWIAIETRWMTGDGDVCTEHEQHFRVDAGADVRGGFKGSYWEPPEAEEVELDCVVALTAICHAIGSGWSRGVGPSPDRLMNDVFMSPDELRALAGDDEMERLEEAAIKQTWPERY